MRQYFSKMPLVRYDVDGSGEQRDAVNILRRVRVRPSIFQEQYVYYAYPVKDGELPEVIAHKYYGSPQYHSVVLLANNVVDPFFDWPLSYDNLIATIQERYTADGIDGFIVSQRTIHHYEDARGNIIDKETYDSLPANERNVVMVFDWEAKQNENKRNIKLIDKDYLDQIDREMDELLA